MDGVTGFLVPPDDVPAAAEAVPGWPGFPGPPVASTPRAGLTWNLSLDAHERLYRRVSRE